MNDWERLADDLCEIDYVRQVLAGRHFLKVTGNHREHRAVREVTLYGEVIYADGPKLERETRVPYVKFRAWLNGAEEITK